MAGPRKKYDGKGYEKSTPKIESKEAILLNPASTTPPSPTAHQYFHPPQASYTGSAQGHDLSYSNATPSVSDCTAFVDPISLVAFRIQKHEQLPYNVSWVGAQFCVLDVYPQLPPDGAVLLSSVTPTDTFVLYSSPTATYLMTASCPYIHCFDTPAHPCHTLDDLSSIRALPTANSFTPPTTTTHSEPFNCPHHDNAQLTTWAYELSNNNLPFTEWHQKKAFEREMLPNLSRAASKLL